MLMAGASLPLWAVMARELESEPGFERALKNLLP